MKLVVPTVIFCMAESLPPWPSCGAAVLSCPGSPFNPEIVKIPLDQDPIALPANLTPETVLESYVKSPIPLLTVIIWKALSAPGVPVCP